NLISEEMTTATISRNYMDSIYNGVVDPLFVLEQQDAIQSFNPSVTRTLGYAEEELKGKSFFSLIHSTRSEEHRAAIADEFEQKGYIANIEIGIRASSGKFIPTVCSISQLYDTKNEKSGILVIAKDITRQKEAEEELRKAKERAEEANVAKSRFLAN